MGTINAGKCPVCADTIFAAEADAIKITRDGMPMWNGVAYHCPSCKTVLGVQIDPISIRNDVVQMLKDALNTPRRVMQRVISSRENAEDVNGN